MNILPGESNPALKNLRKNSRPVGMLNMALQKRNTVMPQVEQPRNILPGINTSEVRNAFVNKPLVPANERQNMGETLIEQKPAVETGSWFSKLFGGRKSRKASRKGRKASRKALKKSRKTAKKSRKGRKASRKH